LFGYSGDTQMKFFFLALGVVFPAPCDGLFIERSPVRREGSDRGFATNPGDENRRADSSTKIMMYVIGRESRQRQDRCMPTCRGIDSGRLPMSNGIAIS